MTKKIISVILAVCMVLSMAAVAGITASAAEGTTFIIAGEAALCTSNWSETDTNNQMTLNEGTGFYEKTYTDVAPGTYQFKVTQGDWNLENWGSPALDNYYLQVDEACDVTIAFDPVEEVIYATGSGVGVYEPNIEAIYACGNGEDDWLNGIEWGDAFLSEDNMMEEVSEGVYKITFEGYIPEYDNYQIKFSTKDWANNWGGSKVEGVDNTLYVGDAMDLTYNGENIIFNAPCDLASVTFTFDISEFDFGTGKGAKASVEYVPDEDAEYYIVAGEASLCTDNWVESSFRNVMFYDGNADEFQKVYKDVPAGSYQFKVVKNSDWDQSWGNAAGANFDLVVDEACDVTIHFDYNENVISVTGDGIGSFVYQVDSVYIVGNGEEGTGWMNEIAWTPNAADNQMEEIAEDVYQITFTDILEFDNYQFKFAANGDWKINWGGAQGADNTIRPNGAPFALTPNGENVVFDCPDLDEVTITLDLSNYDPETGVGAFVTVTSNEEPVENANLKFSGNNLALANSLEINYLVRKDRYEAFEDVYVAFARNDANKGVVETIVRDCTPINQDGRDFYLFTYKGVNPQLLGDDITATLYGRNVDTLEWSCGVPFEFNAKAYTYGLISDERSKTLAVDLLNYATAAQEYTNYRIDTPINGDLTPAQAAFGTQTPHNYNDIFERIDLEGKKVNFRGASVVLGSSIAGEFVFAPARGVEVDMKDVTVKISVGNRENAGVYTYEDFGFDGTNYTVQFDKAYANELSDKITVIAYDKDDNVISNTFIYSIESYVAQSIGGASAKDAALYNTMMNYGYSVMAYAGKPGPVVD